MKKYLLFLTLLFTSIFTFAQRQTTSRSFHKIKMGHGAAYDYGMEKHNTKFFPISNSRAMVIWNITGLLVSVCVFSCWLLQDISITDKATIE